MIYVWIVIASVQLTPQIFVFSAAISKILKSDFSFRFQVDILSGSDPSDLIKIFTDLTVIVCDLWKIKAICNFAKLN